MAKNYFAIVHKTTGKFLLSGACLPIYWLKKVAMEEAKNFKDYIVQPVDIKEMERILLNPKTVTK